MSLSPSRIDTSRASDEYDEVSGVAVEVLSASVVDGGCVGVGVTGSELHVTQRDTGIDRSHDERATKQARVDVS